MPLIIISIINEIKGDVKGRGFKCHLGLGFFLCPIREGTFFIGGGWAGASEGRVISKFLSNWGGSNLFYSQPGEGHSFFGKKTLLHVASILYIQAKLPVKINLNYLQVSKNLYIKKLSSPN